MMWRQSKRGAAGEAANEARVELFEPGGASRAGHMLARAIRAINFLTAAPSRAKLARSRAAAALGTLLPFALCVLMSSCRPSMTEPVRADATSGFCPVCHMKVKAGDPWTSEIYYSDGTKLMFESAGDMMSFYSAPDNYKVPDAQKDRAKIDKIVVKDYQTKDEIDAQTANLVYKSKIEGPMGPDFLAFSRREDAESFVAANGGRVVALNEVTPEMVQNLRKK
jgi:nitrous oxide reductase accessory protein NosL